MMQYGYLAVPVKIKSTTDDLNMMFKQRGCLFQETDDINIYKPGTLSDPARLKHKKRIILNGQDQTPCN